jgi:hypothetical protein
MAMGYFDADCVEEETAGTGMEPHVVEAEVREDFDPDFGGEDGETGY